MRGGKGGEGNGGDGRGGEGNVRKNPQTKSLATALAP